MSGVGPRYRILRRLGQGGMAEVFEAELVGELGFVRKVAIKRMLGDAAADGVAARRFLDEARIASRLHHANVVAVTDVGLLDGLPFQVLELVDGINVHQLMRRAGGRLPLEIALAIAGEVAHALDHAHGARDHAGALLGVVHRDVKPANVLVSWAGDVKLGDFGIAVARDRETRTATGHVAGTAGFIAPEQRTRSEVDGRTDVFALGLTLHAMIAGRSPLEELAAEIAVIEGAAPPLDAGLPADVRLLLARALSPSRLDRPLAGAFADAIGAALAPRITRDARSQLRSFLDGLAEPRRPAPGALDLLLGIDIVVDAKPAHGVARYHTVAPAEARTVPEIVQPDADDVARGRNDAGAVAMRAGGAGEWRGADAMHEGGAIERAGARHDAAASDPRGAGDELASARPRRGALALVAGVAAVAAAGALGWWGLADRDSASSPAPVIAAGDRSDAAGEGSSAALVVDAGPTAVEPRDADVPATALDAQHDRRRRAKHDARPAALATADAATPVEPGWLQVYGDELVGAKVLVDGGRYAGYVPNKIPVPPGRHRVVVEPRGGAPLPAKQVDITESHTAVSPLRLTW